jgi:hypothetical protein
MDHQDIDDERILIDLSKLKPMVDKPDELLDYLDILLLSGSMSAEMKVILKDAYQQTASNETNDRLTNLLFLIMISPQYTVQK